MVLCSCSCSCLSIDMSICKLENEAILQDFLQFLNFIDNIKNAAILREFLIFLNLTTSKTKKFCKISSFFEVDNIKNEAILRNVLQKCKVERRAVGIGPMRFAIFLFHLSGVLHLLRKSAARSFGVLHLSRKIILSS